MSEAINWHGPDELRPFLVPIGSLQPHPRNPRRGNVAMVMDSLQLNGQTRHIVVWDAPGASLIVAGNHTHQAATRIGWTHIAALRDPAMTEDEALEFLIADNHASDRATYDEPKIIELLQRLYDRGDLAGTGYDADDLDDLIAKANQVSETARKNFEGGFAETDEERDARAQRAGGQGEVKQLPLSYDAETHRALSLKLQTLSKHFDTGGITDTVREAVRREWAEVWG